MGNVKSSTMTSCGTAGVAGLLVWRARQIFELILPFSVAVSIVVHRPFAALSAVDGIAIISHSLWQKAWGLDWSYSRSILLLRASSLQHILCQSPTEIQTVEKFKPRQA